MGNKKIFNSLVFDTTIDPDFSGYCDYGIHLDPKSKQSIEGNGVTISVYKDVSEL